MKKIILNTIEDRKYQVIKKLLESNDNKLKAALKLHVTPRTIDRLILKYKQFGKEGFIHGNRNRKPKHSMTFDEKEKIVSLYKEKYFDCNIQHFSELLADRERIKCHLHAAIDDSTGMIVGAYFDVQELLCYNSNI